jgi:hypothetical protein
MHVFFLQIYPEVEPKFILQFWKDLRSFWHILDNKGNRNILEYNNNFDHPLIIGGWNTLSNFVGFGNNVDDIFAYYGHRCFEIISWYQIESLPKIRPFHSRSTHPRCTKSYDIKLTADMVQQTKLVESFNLLLYY